MHDAPRDDVPARRRLLLFTIATIATTPSAALAQAGKIDGVERSAGSSSGNHGDEGGGEPWLVRLLGGLFHGAHCAPDTTPDTTRALAPQSYLRFPYDGRGRAPRFVLPDTSRPAFGAVAAQRFIDASSTLRGVGIDFEGAVDRLHWDLAYTYYREVKRSETDQLHDGRASLGVALPFLRTGYVAPGAAFRLVCLDDGRCAAGGDAEIAARIFPLRPFGLSATQRLGAVKWAGGDWIMVSETNAAASVQIGRLEVSAGWHWLKLATAPAFAGPTAGVRVWF